MVSQNALVGEPNTATKFGNIQAKEPRIIKVLKIILVAEVTKYWNYVAVKARRKKCVLISFLECYGRRQENFQS